MLRLTSADVARLCAGEVVGDPGRVAAGFGADSRDVVAGHAFVAVRGGHVFVGEALDAGASFAIVDRREALAPDAAAVVVDDTVRALAALAVDRRRSLAVRVVAITGSTGKTLTKDFVAAALSVRYRVHAAPSSYNTEVTVPLVVLTCPDDAEVLVSELGARHPGEIDELCRIVRPEIGIVTGIGLTHVGEFGSRRAIASTKAELLASLPADGVAVVPSTDDFLGLLAAATTARTVTVGPGGSVRFDTLGLEPDGRAIVRVRAGRNEVVVRPPLPGRPFASNAAQALAVAGVMGVELASAAEAIATAPTSAWRMQVRRAGERVLVNDAYNANPTSVAAALRTVNELAAGRERWGVLGEMAELGEASAREHARMGRLAAALGFRVLAVSSSATYGAGAATVDDADAALAVLARGCAPDAVVLVKASRSVELDGLAGALADTWTRSPARGSG